MSRSEELTNHAPDTLVEQLSSSIIWLTEITFINGTVNIRTRKDDLKLENCISEIAKDNLSVCAFQEVRRLNSNSVKIDTNMNNNNIKYELYWSGYSTKRQHGVAIAIKVENGVEIEEVLPVSNCCKRYYSWMLTSNHLLLCFN